ncbi:MAG: Citrate lyase alpha chain [Syntrophaceae bacterium PtaU1.Bin231]|nr:MAG: Citrate lyase alpha chain [Syntrophaceae bacterium PtaU1.Bin231]
MKTSIGTEIPEFIDKKKGRGRLKPFEGAWTRLQKGWMDEPTVSLPTKAKMPHVSKMEKDLKTAIEKTGPRDGMTVSFHHHLRNGDAIVNLTIDILAELGIKNITLAASSLTSVHRHLIPYLEDGTITEIWTSGMRDELGAAVSMGKLAYRAVIHSHGGRARAIRTGELSIDLAVLAASAADEEGNATGCHGPSAFGSMGYAIMDARYAKQVIVVTDNIVPYPCFPVSIEQTNVDYVVKVDSLGDVKKIASGTTRITKKPLDLRLASLCAQVIEHSGYMENGFSFQVGAGGASSSLLNNRNHIEISSDMYANPFNCGSMINKLDVVVLGALAVDVNFNVNVITGSEGTIMGASGGHCDTAAGAKLTVVVCPSFRGRIPSIKRNVHHIVTPGESVHVIVTERGICVNPAYKDLEARLKKAGLFIRDIHDLHDRVDKLTGVPDPIEYKDRVVAVIEYRDGTTIDVVRQIKC